MFHTVIKKYIALKTRVVVCVFASLMMGNVSALEIMAPQAFVYDMQSGQVLLNKQGMVKMYPASMTKIMTAYVIFDAIRHNTISMQDTFYISKKAFKMGGSRMFLEMDTNVSVDVLLKGLIIQSGNDSAVALAEGLAGTETAFANLMNATAKKLGMKNTHFTNSTGWPDTNHYTSAKDLVILSEAIIRDFPEHFYLWGQKNYTYNKIKQGNRNPLLYMNIGVDGLKTGHTEASGYGLTASALKNNRRVLFVLNGMVSKKRRKEESAKLVREFLYNYRNILAVKQGKVLDTAPVFMQYGVKLPLVSNTPIYMSQRTSNMNPLTVKIEYKSPIIPPLKSGDVVGRIIVQSLDKAGKNTTTIAYPLHAGADVSKNNIFDRVYSLVMTTVFGTP